METNDQYGAYKPVHPTLFGLKKYTKFSLTVEIKD